jgi:hypothetical protein
MIFGDPTANINPETGVRYGVTSAQNHPWLYEHITQNGNSLSYQWWRDEIQNSLGRLDDLDLPTLSREEVQSEIEASIKDYVPSYWLERNIEYAVDAVFEDSEDGDVRYVPGEFQTWDSILSVSSRIFSALEENLGEAFEGGGGEGEDYELDDGDASYLIQYLGGAPLIWVTKSPRIVYVKSLCSPCVPNAGDLDSGMTTEEEGYECYGIPEEWEGKGE